MENEKSMEDILNETAQRIRDAQEKSEYKKKIEEQTQKINELKEKLQEQKKENNPVYQFFKKITNKKTRITQQQIKTQEYVEINRQKLLKQDYDNAQELQLKHAQITRDLKTKTYTIENGRINAINLSEQQLTEIPPQIYQLDQLQELYIQRNQITTIPDEIIRLKELKKIDLSQNRIKKMNKNIEKLTELQELNLNNNRLTEISYSITNLSQLRKLELADNYIKKAPRNIQKLYKLNELNLSSNQIQKIPRILPKLPALKKVYLCDTPIKIIDNLKILDRLKEKGITCYYTPTKRN